MPFDALFLTAMTRELSAAVGMRVDQVRQPTRDTVLLQLRGRQGARQLLLCVNPNHPRVQFTALSFENPAQPPMFCMLLRKHLTGARLSALSQPPMERLLDLTLDCMDELGDAARRHLIVELMGRSANLILTDPDGRILDCLRRVDLEMSETRQVLPGLYYRLPPAQEKADPFSLTEEDFVRLLSEAPPSQRMERALLESLAGLSPLLCRELACRICGEADALIPRDCAEAARALHAFFASPPYAPTLLLEEGAPKDFACVPITQYGSFLERVSYPDCSSLLDECFGARERSERRRQRAQALTKTVTTQRDRTARKLALQKKELEDSLDREQLRRFGDLVTANLYRIRKGQTLLRTENFYDPALCEVEIPLQAQLSPQQNAARYYKEYAKAKNAEKFLTEQIAAGETKLRYLSSVLDELSRAETDRDLSEIREELVGQGIVRETDRKKQKMPPAKPLERVSASGFRILIGRNNRQNELVTFRLAAKNDIWFHVKGLHGSHTVLLCRGAEPDDETVTEAAGLAAWYSEARGGQNVPVDTTLVRNVKKPPASPPGFVTYTHQRTLFVTPQNPEAD